MRTVFHMLALLAAFFMVDSLAAYSTDAQALSEAQRALNAIAFFVVAASCYAIAQTFALFESHR